MTSGNPDQREAMKPKNQRLADLFSVLRPTEPEPNGFLLELCYRIEAMTEESLTGTEWADLVYQAYKSTKAHMGFAYAYWSARVRFAQRLSQVVQVLFSHESVRADFNNRFRELISDEAAELGLYGYETNKWDIKSPRHYHPWTEEGQLFHRHEEPFATFELSPEKRRPEIIEPLFGPDDFSILRWLTEAPETIQFQIQPKAADFTRLYKGAEIFDWEAALRKMREEASGKKEIQQESEQQSQEGGDEQ